MCPGGLRSAPYGIRIRCIKSLATRTARVYDTAQATGRPYLPRSAMPPARPTLTPLQSLLARATYEEQVARATEARRAKAADTAAVLRGGKPHPEVDRLHRLHRPHSEVVILLTPQEWRWLAEAAAQAGPVPPRIASYLGWRTQ